MGDIFVYSTEGTEVKKLRRAGRGGATRRRPWRLVTAVAVGGGGVGGEQTDAVCFRGFVAFAVVDGGGEAAVAAVVEEEGGDGGDEGGGEEGEGDGDGDELLGNGFGWVRGLGEDEGGDVGRECGLGGGRRFGWWRRRVEREEWVFWSVGWGEGGERVLG